MLNHKRKGIEGIYNKNQELELRAAGFALWERDLLAARGPQASLRICSYLRTQPLPARMASIFEPGAIERRAEISARGLDQPLNPKPIGCAL